MNGELAFLVTLVSHGNAYLGGPTDSAAPDLLQNPSARFTESVEFMRASQKVAGSTSEWLDLVKSEGAQRMWLVELGVMGENKLNVEPRMLEAFSNAVGRAAQVDYEDGRQELWFASWGIGNREHPERRIWRVSVECVPPQEHIHQPQPDVQGAYNALLGALEQIRDFAISVEEEFWGAIFTQALTILREGRSDLTQGTDLLPEAAYTPLARRMLAGAATAWVFGGMGSWNDLGFSDDAQNAEYERVSQVLYDAVLNAIFEATNSYKSIAEAG